HALQPCGATEQHREHEDEDAEQEADPAVDRRPAPAPHHFPSSTYVVWSGGANTRPSRVRARVWMRGAAAALESSDASAALSPRRCARSRPSLSSRTFSCSTATLSATTPARRV